MAGIGKSYDNNFSSYVGEHANGVRSGFGIFETKDGRKFEGNWRNNKLHG